MKLQAHRAHCHPLVFGAGFLALLSLTGAAYAQQAPDLTTHAPQADTSSAALPEAPDAAGELQAIRAAGAPGAASVRIKGVISDMQGGLVPGARVVVACPDPPVTQEINADAEGFFSIGGLPAGTYSVTISSTGLETYVLRNLHLKAGEVYSLPEVALPIARTSADVTVTLTTEQLAEEELHNELKQRVLGVLPNFYTSYQWDAAPLSARQKLKLTTRALTDPVFFGTTAITAGIEQAQNTYPEYGGGPAGYWKRYGAAYGDALIGRFMDSVVFSSVFHQDPRYFVMTNGGWKRRAWHAISSTVIQRGDNYHWQPGYSHLLGSATSAMIASTYHPDSSIGKLVLDDTILDLGSKAANNLIREFVLRHLAKNIPSYAKGKPPEE